MGRTEGGHGDMEMEGGSDEELDSTRAFRLRYFLEMETDRLGVALASFLSRSN